MATKMTNFDNLVFSVVRWSQRSMTKADVAGVLRMGRRNTRRFTAKVGRSLLKLSGRGLLNRVVKKEMITTYHPWQRVSYTPRRVSYYSMISEALE